MRLALEFGWSPQIVAELTPEQQLMYWNGLQHGAADGIDRRTGRAIRRFATAAEAVDFLAKRKARRGE